MASFRQWFQSLKPRVYWFRLKREDCEHRLVHLPKRLLVDERGQRLEAESVLTLGELALLAERRGVSISGSRLCS